MTGTKMLKRNIVNVTKYQLSVIVVQLGIFMLTLALNFVIGLIVGSGGSLDLVAIAYGLALGALFFAVSFKFSLVNGVSRHTLFISCILTLLINSAALTALAGLFMCIANAGNTFNFYFLMYGKNYAGLFPWLLSAMLMTQMLGWFIAVFFYRASKKVKLIVLAVFLLLVPFFFLFNFIANGALGKGVVSLLKILIGIAGGASNPFISMVSLFVISAALLGGVYLMLKKAVIKS